MARERVREEILDILCPERHDVPCDVCKFTFNCKRKREADQIPTIEGLAILSDEQELPTPRHTCTYSEFGHLGEEGCVACFGSKIQAQGWKKVE